MPNSAMEGQNSSQLFAPGVSSLSGTIWATVWKWGLSEWQIPPSHEKAKVKSFSSGSSLEDR